MPSSTITALASVPRGACARVPVRYELSAEEIEALRKANGLDNDDDEEEETKETNTNPKTGEIPGLPRRLWFTAADDDDDDRDVVGAHATGASLDDDDMRDDEDDSDAGDVALKPSDALFAAGRAEDDWSGLELHVYDDEASSLYVRHDVALGAFPLTLEWLRLPGRDNDEGNSFVAVGTFETAIEIWNLDVLDAIEPTVTLGGATTVKKKKKKVKTTSKQHSDAVSALSWNRATSTTLASGSADATVKLWDLEATESASSASWSTGGKVQAVQWHPREMAALAYGGDDRRVTLRDCRARDAANVYPRLDADLASLAWNPVSAASLVASCDDGALVCYDVRGGPSRAPLFSFKAHAAAVSAVAFNDRGLLASASYDKAVKLWWPNGMGSSSQQPALVASREMGVGKLFALAFDEGDPFLLATGGSKGTLALWDTTENDQVAALARAAGGEQQSA